MADETGSESTRHSDDPDYQRLWAMSFRDLIEIENDPEHPLHEKASAVGREVAAPLRSAIQFSTAPLTEHFSAGLGVWAKQAIGASFLGLKNAVSPITSPPPIRDLVPHVDAKFIGSGSLAVDIEADEAPQASAAEVQDAMQVAANGFLEEIVAIQRRQLDHQEAEATKGETREKTNRRILWGTLIVAGLTLLATVVLGIPGFLDNLA